MHLRPRRHKVPLDGLLSLKMNISDVTESIERTLHQYLRQPLNVIASLLSLCNIRIPVPTYQLYSALSVPSHVAEFLSERNAVRALASTSEVWRSRVQQYDTSECLGVNQSINPCKQAIQLQRHVTFNCMFDAHLSCVAWVSSGMRQRLLLAE